MKVLAVLVMQLGRYAAQIAAAAFGLWLTASVAMSVFKATFDRCGSHYGIERFYVESELFCRR